MKVYISADIEGTTGINSWDETEKSKPDYSKFKEQMNREVNAACLGAMKAGANEILVKDAHDSGRNLDASCLPEGVKLISGWSHHPFSMVQELDNTFDAVIFTGYHSYGGSSENPLAHTMNPLDVDYIKINGEYASEFTIHAYAAAYVKVPCVFISGDEGICNEAKKMVPNIKAVAVNEGIGGSTISIHPVTTVKKIQKEVENALRRDLHSCNINLPDKFTMEIRYFSHKKAYKASFYPGAKLIDSKSIEICADDYFDILRAILFLT